MNYGKTHLMADAHSKKEKLLAQRQKLDAVIKAIEAKERSQRRKDDTRRKIILGGLVMNAARFDPNIMTWLKSLGSGETVSQKDRDLLDPWFEAHTKNMTLSPEPDASDPGGNIETSGASGGSGIEAKDMATDHPST